MSAVASRDAAKARSFAQETGLARHFASYDALLADRDIDAVYIPLPNSLHAEWSGAAPEESIDNMLTLDAIHASARGGGAIEIPPQA